MPQHHIRTGATGLPIGGGFEHSTAPGIFHSMWEKNRFIKYFGVIGIFGPIVIFVYYTYVESWLLGYCWFSATGAYANLASHEQLKGFLNDYRIFGGSKFVFAYSMFVVTFILNILVINYGINKGIERVCKWALPVLFILAIVLVVRVFTLGTPNSADHPDWNISSGLSYMWTPRWESLKHARIWFGAAGQIFFTLSVGIGVILTYASYLRRKDDVVLSGLTAASTNEFAEVILGGSLIIPAAFALFGPDAVQYAASRVAANSNFDLSAVTMPRVLQCLPPSQVFGVAWFVLLFLAGLTSSISLAQPAISFLEDEFNLSKRKAVLIFAAVAFVLCQAPIFFLANGVMDELDFWGGTFCLIIFGTVEVYSLRLGLRNGQGLDRTPRRLRHHHPPLLPLHHQVRHPGLPALPSWVLDPRGMVAHYLHWQHQTDRPRRLLVRGGHSRRHGPLHGRPRFSRLARLATQKTRGDHAMITSGFILMPFTWTVIIVLFVYSLTRTLRAKDDD